MEKIVKPLLQWYEQNKRILPWRVDQNPYHVWISEIMLQQTRIEAVIDYYYRFMRELPTIEALAECPEDKLLKLWEGLGYYNRVRNLQRAAQIIMRDYHGEFPNTYEEILSLPGIGEYTASAISSICFALREATVDGNVLRVYMRICNCYEDIDDRKTKDKVRKEIMKIMPNDAGNFNEGLMELGETICIPNGVPKCEKCPVRSYCKAYQENTFLQLPVKKGKKEKKEEFYTVFLFFYHGEVAICKRKEKGLLHSMWQFPNVESSFCLSDTISYLEKHNIPFMKVEPSISHTHIFTHKKWNMVSYLVHLKDKIDLCDLVWTTLEELETIYAIPTAFQPFKKAFPSFEEEK